VEVVANTARSPPRIRSPFAGRSRSRTRSGGNAAETAPPWLPALPTLALR